MAVTSPPASAASLTARSAGRPAVASAVSFEPCHCRRRCRFRSPTPLPTPFPLPTPPDPPVPPLPLPLPVPLVPLPCPPRRSSIGELPPEPPAPEIVAGVFHKLEVVVGGSRPPSRGLAVASALRFARRDSSRSEKAVWASGLGATRPVRSARSKRRLGAERITGAGGHWDRPSPSPAAPSTPAPRACRPAPRRCRHFHGKLARIDVGDLGDRVAARGRGRKDARATRRESRGRRSSPPWTSGCARARLRYPGGRPDHPRRGRASTPGSSSRVFGMGSCMLTLAPSSAGWRSPAGWRPRREPGQELAHRAVRRRRHRRARRPARPRSRARQAVRRASRCESPGAITSRSMATSPFTPKVMLTLRSSSESRVCAAGRSTGKSATDSIGAVTSRMMTSTSATSMIGVTLILVIGARRSPPAIESCAGSCHLPSTAICAAPGA